MNCMSVAYVDAHVMEEKDNACQTIAQIAQSTGYILLFTKQQTYYVNIINSFILHCNHIYLYLN